MAEHQGPRRHAAVQIVVHGMQDVTSKLHPYLISVQVIDKQGEDDECHIELDDRYAELMIPPNGVKMQVYMGWDGEGPRLFDSGRRGIASIGEGGFGQGPIAMSPEEIDQERRFGGPGLRIVFDGWVDEVESGFGRKGGGRRLWVTGKGHDGKSTAKETKQGFVGEGKKEDGQEGQKIPLRDALTKVFGGTGLQVALSPDMAKIERDYWSWRDSPANFGKRLADETGGIFKIAGGMATLVGKNSGQNANGDAMPTVDAVWGINLIGWRIKPFTTRPQYGEAQAKFFDLAKGAYETIKGAVGGSTAAPFGGNEAIANAANTVVDKAQGEQVNKGTGATSENKRGIGWVLLNGEPNAKANGTLSITGARPGVDGDYTIDEVEHNYQRGVGFTTRCNVTNPRPTGGYTSWVTEPEPGDPSFIGPMPWPQAPDIPVNELILTDSELWRWREVEKLREETPKVRTDGLVPITRDELGPDGVVPPGYVLVGPPPVAQIDIAPGINPPISGEQTFTAADMEAVRQGQIEEVERQQRINGIVNNVMADVQANAMKMDEELRNDVQEMLGQLNEAQTLSEKQDIAKDIGDMLGTLK